jgi:ribose/xylose/arabinose/galactoside ABC-type transport system permease subunit
VGVVFVLGAYMNSIADNSIADNNQVAATPASVSARDVLAVICGLGLVMFACMATNGLDLSVGFF